MINRETQDMMTQSSWEYYTSYPSPNWKFVVDVTVVRQLEREKGYFLKEGGKIPLCDEMYIYGFSFAL